MTNDPITPKLSGGPKISIDEITIKTLDCPKCQKQLAVTDLIFGTNIECPDCGNKTWVPEYKPRWWFKLRNFLFTVIITFIIGVFAAIAADWFMSIKIIPNEINNENNLKQ